MDCCGCDSIFDCSSITRRRCKNSDSKRRTNRSEQSNILQSNHSPNKVRSRSNHKSKRENRKAIGCACRQLCPNAACDHRHAIRLNARAGACTRPAECCGKCVPNAGEGWPTPSSYRARRLPQPVVAGRGWRVRRRHQLAGHALGHVLAKQLGLFAQSPIVCAKRVVRARHVVRQLCAC
jgi:hypothetical protein